MHEPVISHLENYLAGTIAQPHLQAVESHVASCPSCRSEIQAFAHVSECFITLKPSAEIEPRAGFYGRVWERIEAQSATSFWNLFLEPALLRGLGYAALTVLTVGLTYWVSQPKDTEDVLASIQVPPPIVQTVALDDQPDNAQQSLSDAQNASFATEAPDPDSDAILTNLASFPSSEQ